jgi:fibronectin type 3 domain-containing protein
VIPAAPTGLAAAAGNGSVSLSWTGSSGAASYNVYDGTTSAGVNGQPVMTGITTTSATVSGLNNGTTYYFTVAAVDAGGTSAASSQANAKPVAPSKSGGGSMDWLALALLAFAAGSRQVVGRRCAAPAPTA